MRRIALSALLLGCQDVPAAEPRAALAEDLARRHVEQAGYLGGNLNRGLMLVDLQLQALGACAAGDAEACDCARPESVDLRAAACESWARVDEAREGLAADALLGGAP